MNPHSLLSLLLALGMGLILRAQAGEYEIHTADGQTLQGEYLGMEDGVVKLRTKYGVLQVAAKDVVTMTAVVAAPKPAPADQAAGDQPAAEKPAGEQPVAEKPVAEKPAGPSRPPPPPAKPEPKEGAKAEHPDQPPPPPLAFPEPRMPDPVALANARAALEPAPPEPSKKERQDIFRAMRDFADTNAGNRKKFIRILQSYGRMAEPFIASAYTDPAELNERVDFLEALAVPGRTLSTPVFAAAHRQALAALDQAANSGQQMPPAYASMFDRDRPPTRGELMKLAAANVLDLEGFMSTAGGPFNTLFLLDLYRKRYTSDKTDPLLLGLARDRTRLAAAAADGGRSRSSWNADERLGVIELALPMLFKDDDAITTLAQSLLAKLLPTGHPKWDADEEAWVEWWKKAKGKIK